MQLVVEEGKPLDAENITASAILEMQYSSWRACIGAENSKMLILLEHMI